MSQGLMIIDLANQAAINHRSLALDSGKWNWLVKGVEGVGDVQMEIEALGPLPSIKGEYESWDERYGLIDDFIARFRKQVLAKEDQLFAGMDGNARKALRATYMIHLEAFSQGVNGRQFFSDELGSRVTKWHMKHVLKLGEEDVEEHLRALMKPAVISVNPLVHLPPVLLDLGLFA
jgi:hypothetical protein